MKREKFQKSGEKKNNFQMIVYFEEIWRIDYRTYVLLFAEKKEPHSVAALYSLL
ncbi:hypothetical protein GJU41_05645 [Bacillus idriensis]|uniref:Uncharacterized protein n=1 Tax=Metabacillus idriensis TaxID=324768 RepID=A0A6I2M934_9BACI|nr:hypothetical protein [Metabacillus idriensis]MRX53446.1 hypothetical protein [Metabacillus idriensis]